MLTPLEAYPKLAAAIGAEALFFKREDLHPYGSHKGRSIPFMVDTYLKAGERRFAITGSGNAALAAALYAKEINARNNPDETIGLDIYMGNHAAPHKVEKIKKLESEHIRLLIKERPLQALAQASQEGARSLRQSTDDTALAGYESLAYELSQDKKPYAVFIGTSSGTTAQALAKYFIGSKSPIQVHIVQTSSCHPMAEAFEPYDGPEEDSVADAVVDKTAYRKDAVTPLVDKTGGRGWIVTNEEIEGAMEFASKHTGLGISPNSALSVAGAMKAAGMGFEFPGPVVCMICGD